MKLATQYHQHEVGITVKDWQHNIISMKLASQYETGNIITARSWHTSSQHETGTSSARGWHIISTRLAHHHSTRLAHHLHEAGTSSQHEAGITALG
jgi:hypothetical protein